MSSLVRRVTSSRGTLVALVALVALAISPPGAGTVLAQQETGTIRGRVTAQATGRPLEGAQVSIPGSTRGALTNELGEFVISGVPFGQKQVRAQRIGFAPLTRAVAVAPGQTATVSFPLAESPISLEAVVVTGTAATARKKEIGNSMATIGARQIENAPVVNPQQVLAAQAPGVTVLQNSGQPGAGGTIRLRGNNSVSQGNNPIIYVDGVRIYSENGPIAPGSRQQVLALNDIKADDIDRLEIVKGAAATTLYGTEASGGVIQIFTKKGSAGAPQWTAEVTQGMNRMGHVGPASDKTGLFLNQCRGDGLVNSLGQTFVDPTCPASGTWLRTGPVQRYNLSVRGGAEQMTYYVSGSYNDDEGVIPNSYAKDGGFRGNFGFSPAKTLTLALNSTYNKKQIRWVPDGNNANGLFLSVARGPNGNFKGGKGDDCAGVPSSVTCVSNKYILDQEDYNRSDHFITGLTATWAPTLAFTNRFNVGYDYNVNDNQLLFPFGYLSVPKGSISVYTWNHTKLSLDYAGSYLNSFSKSIASTFSWGGQLFEDRESYQVITGADFAGPGDPTLGSAARLSPGSILRQRVINAGYFVQEMLAWRDRLFVTGGLRVDGNSAFGQNFGLQKYPKLSASYVLSEHAWWPTRYIETFKLRSALGESGKAPGAFDAVRTWDPIAADEGQPAFTPAQRGNPNLGPERTREVEVGFDASALDGRLALEATAFRTRTHGALIGVVYPASLGFLSSQLQNVGLLENKGIELQLDAGLVRTELLDWHAKVTYTGTKSTALNTGGQIVATGNGTSVREGYPVPAYFGSKITNPGATADPVVATDSYIGPQYPTKVVGLNTTITVGKRLTLDALGEYQGGQYLANFVGYQNALRDIWQPCYAVQAALRAAQKGDASALGSVTAEQRGKCQSSSIDRTKANSDYWIQPASFFKLRTVSLTYRLPERLVPLGKTASLTLAGRNLFTSTRYDGTDPEVQDAADSNNRLGRREYYQLPPFRTFLATLRMTF